MNDREFKKLKQRILDGDPPKLNLTLEYYVDDDGEVAFRGDGILHGTAGQLIALLADYLSKDGNSDGLDILSEGCIEARMILIEQEFSG